MHIRMVLYLIAASSLLVSCAQQEVALSVGAHAQHEGVRYADEVDAQSPFKPVKMSWSGAQELMEERNIAYRKARSSYLAAAEEKPMVTQLRSQLKKSVGISVKDVLKPNAIAKSLQDPIVGLPKQLGSISALKDISHSMQQVAWKNEGDSIGAKMLMRKERVKLYTLLSKGDVIEGELARIRGAEAQAEKEVDVKLQAAQKKWRASVEKDRDVWLAQVRDFFNAEYYDVLFEKDSTVMPMYRNVKAPDLSEWQRWCFLNRSQSLVKALKTQHKDSKPAVPGTRMVKAKVAEMMDREPEYEVELKTDDVRGEVRKLISNWREMKRAQAELRESKTQEKLDAKAELARAQRMYRLRQQEIKHASVVWLMDEHCWDGEPLLSGL